MTEKLLRCPFNRQHIFPEKTLQKHILKCMVNYPDYVACPYNALHRLPNQELLCKHMLVCESKAKLMSQDINDITDLSTTDIHDSKIRSFNLEVENWDA